MILIFDLFETLIISKSMDFNRALKVLWEKDYKDKCSLEEICTLGDQLFNKLLDYHKEGKEYAFVKDELPEYARAFGGEVINMTAEEECDFLMLCNDCVLMPGIQETLCIFQKMRIPMYVLSNSGFSQEALALTLDRLGIRNFFSKIWSSADYGYIKPEKSFFNMAIDYALEEQPGEGREEVVYVGDTYSSDMIGAVNTGIKAIWLNQKGEENAERLPIDIATNVGELCEKAKILRGDVHYSLLDTTLNTRDLGGYKSEITNSYTKKNSIYRSDAPLRPSQRDIDFLRFNHITTMIDMRTAQNIVDKPSGFAKLDGFSYFHCPIDEGNTVPESVMAVPGSYLKIACSESTTRVFETIANAKEGVMIHCAAGKDRTGVISAILLLLCGVCKKDIIADYMITKDCNKERFKHIKEDMPGVDINIVIPRDNYMADFLELLRNKYHSIENYFKAIGINATQMKQIKEKLL